VTSAAYVACSGEMKNVYKILIRKLKRREYLGDQGVAERNRVGEFGLDSSG
jgi:hypothetical protein